MRDDSVVLAQESQAQRKSLIRVVAVLGLEAAATTVFGAGDLQSIVSQLNLWTPQIELTPQELRGAQLVMSGQMQRAHESQCRSGTSSTQERRRKRCLTKG